MVAVGRQTPPGRRCQYCRAFPESTQGEVPKCSSQFPVLSSQKNQGSCGLALRTENWEPRTICKKAKARELSRALETAEDLTSERPARQRSALR